MAMRFHAAAGVTARTKDVSEFAREGEVGEEVGNRDALESNSPID